MMSRWFICNVVVGVMLGASLQADEAPAVSQHEAGDASITDMPRSRRLVVRSSATIEISIEIEPTTHTSELRVFADSDSYYRSTTIDLDGGRSRRRHVVEWRGFPAGDYDVVGELVDDNGERQVVVRGGLLVID